MRKIELIFFEGCPNVESARISLYRAMKMAKMKPEWIEWNVYDSNCPFYARRYGSPTVLIEGEDVYYEEPGEGAWCRVYTHSDSIPGNAPRAIDIYNHIKTKQPLK